jgi:NitT/TauT family transport system substrate-binding protein
MNKYLKRLCVAFLLCVSCAANAQEKLVFTPQWTAQAQFAGFYVASIKGFYEEEGLDVKIKHPSTSKPSSEYLSEGQSQFITQNLVSAMILRDKGLPLVNVMQVSQQNNLLIVSHTPIKSKEDLKGKKVGYWRSGFCELPMAMDKRFRLGITWVPFLSHINLFISGAIDATLAMSYNELFQLKLAGQRITKDHLMYMRDEGYNVPEDGVYVTADFYREHKDVVERFVRATRKGWEWAFEHQEETLDIVMLTMRQNGTSGNLLSQEWMLKEWLSHMADQKTGKRTYRLEPASLTLANRILLQSGFIQKEITFNQFTQP